MKTIIVRSLVTFFVLASFLFSHTGCRDYNIDNPSSILSETEWKEILKTDSLISLTADSILLSNNPVDGWQKKLNYYNSFPIVEQAWVVDSTALFVKFKKAGIIFWNSESKIESEYKSHLKENEVLPIKPYKGVQENGNVCLINIWYDDEDALYTRDFINQLQSIFKNYNYKVTIKNGAAADIKFFRESLKNYKLIYIIGHGKYGTSNFLLNPFPHTWIQSGEEGLERDYDFLGKYESDWVLGKIALGIEKEKRNEVEMPIQKWSVSENFFNDAYKSTDFPNTLIYFANCQTFKDPNKLLAKTLNAKGAGVILGWDELHYMGLGEQGKKLLETMLNNGIDVSTALNIMANDPSFETGQAGADGPIITSYLTYQTWKNTTSHLVYYPTTGGSVQLTFKPQLQTPDNGYVTSSLTPTLTCQSYAGATNFNFQVALETNFNNPIVNANSSSSQYQIQNGIFTTGTQYFWKVRITNSNGELSPWSDSWSFTTYSNSQLPSLITSDITSITETAASGGGNVTSDGGATVTARGVCWNTAGTPTLADSKTNDGTGSGAFTSSLTGLTAGTPFYVRAYATNSSGTAYGNQVSFTTTNTIPSNEILPLAVGNYWNYLLDITAQTMNISITGTIDIQGETCYKWYATGDIVEWYYRNKPDGCWAFGYSGPFQYPPDLEYKYPANSGDTWVTNWIAVPYQTTMTCESITATFESYTGCYKYHFFMPIGNHNFLTNILNAELLRKLSGLKSTATDGFDIYQYFIPGIGMVGWENYFQGTRLYKVVLTDYHLIK
ncbi:MAG: hypothetical protein NTV01_20380 [Bacteroidia bacterium]|nr:hypothetical protein [Bacteroidia bacterium]